MNSELKRKLINDYNIYITYVLKTMNLTYRYDELFDVAMIGFVQGINTYDEKRNIKPATYLFTCIKNEILKFLKHEKIVNKDIRTISLNAPIGDGQDELQDIIPYESDYIKAVCLDELLYKVNRITSFQKPRQEAMFKYLHGLDGYKKMSATEIAKLFNTSYQNVYDINKRIIKKLKKEMKKYKEEFIEILCK